MAREALGRGLRALLEGTEAVGEAELLHLQVSQVYPNPYQPRQHFDPERLQELADSLKAQGLLQPIVVRRQKSGFELIVGERRWRAAQMAGFETIPALVRPASDEEVLGLALLENLQREDLNPLEEARAYQRLQTEFHLRQEDVARYVGKDRSSIANALRLRPKRTSGPRNAPPRTDAPNRRTLWSSKRRCSNILAPAWRSGQGVSTAKSRSPTLARTIYTACSPCCSSNARLRHLMTAWSELTSVSKIC